MPFREQKRTYGVRGAVVSSVSDLIYKQFLDWHVITSDSKPWWKVNSHSYWFVDWWRLQNVYSPHPSDKLYGIVEYGLFYFVSKNV